MVKFNEIAENEVINYAEMLKDNFEIGDSLIYYHPTIKAHCESLLERKLSNEEMDKITDYLYFNCNDLLEINYGYHVIENRLSLANQEEIEIDLSNLHWTEKRKEIVSRYSDLYINNNGYAYALTGHMHLDIIITKETIKSALSE